MLGQALRESRQQAGLTLDDLAQAAHTSRAAMCNYERGKRSIPEDVLDRAAETLRDPFLRLRACAQCRTGFFRIPFLDQVDLHPISTGDKLAEEAEEIVAGLHQLRLINKRRPEDLSPEERARLQEVMEQVWDVLPAAALYLSVLSRQFGMDLGEVSDHYQHKVFERRYWTAKRVSAEPAPAQKENHRLAPVASRGTARAAHTFPSKLPRK